MKTDDPTVVLQRRLAALAAALLLAGCGGLKTGAPGPTTAAPPPADAPPSADQRAAAPAALSAERQWLQQWFKGTPVRVGQFRDGPVTVDVPREFCFDAGRSEIKPPLAAVLDKVAESLRRAPLAKVSLLAAPGDTAGDALALQRATQLQQRLLARGVAPERIVGRPTPAAALVQLRIE